MLYAYQVIEALIASQEGVCLSSYRGPYVITVGCMLIKIIITLINHSVTFGEFFTKLYLWLVCILYKVKLISGFTISYIKLNKILKI